MCWRRRKRKKSKGASGDDDFAAWLAYREAKESLAEKGSSWGKRKIAKVKRGGETLSGIDTKTGKRGRCYARNGEYHLLPTRPLRGCLSVGTVPTLAATRAPTRPPYTSISFGSPMKAQGSGFFPMRELVRPVTNLCLPLWSFSGALRWRRRTVQRRWTRALLSIWHVPSG